MGEFNFDYWKELYEKDPEEFNKQRLAMLRQVAEQSGRSEDEINQMMARINGQDMRLDRIKNPLARLAKLEENFYNQFFQFNEVLKGFRSTIK